MREIFLLNLEVKRRLNKFAEIKRKTTACKNTAVSKTKEPDITAASEALCIQEYKKAAGIRAKKLFFAIRATARADHPIPEEKER